MSPLCLSGSGRSALATIVQRVGQHRQLAALAGDDLALDADVVAEVDVALPVRQRLLADPVQRDHHLHLAGAVAQRREAQLAADPGEDDPAGDRDPLAGVLVDLEVGVRRAQVGDRRGARDGHRVGLDAPLAHPVELLPADPHLLGQLVAHPARLPSRPATRAGRCGGPASRRVPARGQGWLRS